jgi:hypothetical protein
MIKKMLASKIKVVGITAAALLLAFAGAAYANVLPAELQSAVSGAAETVGVTLPTPDAGPADVTAPGDVQSADQGAVDNTNQGDLSNVDEGAVDNVDQGQVGNNDQTDAENVDQGQVGNNDQTDAQNVDQGASADGQQSDNSAVDQGSVAAPVAPAGSDGGSNGNGNN